MRFSAALFLTTSLCLAGCNCTNQGGGTGGGGGGGGAPGDGVGGGSGSSGDGGADLADAGLADAGLADAGLADPDAGCSYGTAASLAAPGSLDLFGEISYFADGGEVPRGRYRVQYLDGCMKYSDSQGWTIHAYVTGSYGWWLVGATFAEKYLMPPGTAGWDPNAGAFANFADCVAANQALAPLDFDFDGGVLGVWLQDSPYADNLPGEGGRNPVWALTGLGACQP